MSLRIRQYAYFTVRSSILSTPELARQIGLQPDQGKTRGSKIEGDNPIPLMHTWEIHAGSHGDLDDQIDGILNRVRPHTSAIGNLVANDRADAQSMLVIVRYLDDPEGVLDGWQHRLLGYSLKPDDIAVLAEARSSVWLDEYGQDLPWWRFIARRKYAYPYRWPATSGGRTHGE